MDCADRGDGVGLARHAPCLSHQLVEPEATMEVFGVLDARTGGAVWLVAGMAVFATRRTAASVGR